ncbi:uncharacterized protein TRAVEDRAFT_133990, partial [Trametes versicolor FP-101664 SS1]|uniref:uncharacterized protein n=1 Tax=Trametes versicolor (strain FP-101664) TaxID=717944 RepID=UPI00046226C3
LLQLNHDMLMAVIDVLGAHNELTSFSRTCKVIREFCMPVLFRHCKIKVYHPVEFENSLEARRSLSLTMMDYCDNRGKITRPGMLLKHTMDPLLCGVYNPRELGTALRNMPRLHAVSMVLCWAEGHGLPWSVLDAVLTVPHLREFTCDHHEFSPRPIIPKETKNFTDPPAALTAFHYIVSDYRHNSRGYPPEADALRIVLGSLYRTLQIIDLPTEPTSLRHISSLAWPVLRELRLRGELYPAEDRPVPLISALAHMSALRVLDLRFSVTKGSHVPAPPIWPSGLHATYPWPDLKHLVISYANTDDQLFQHLPPTLRRLTLQYFPHLGPSEWDGINTLPVVSLRRYSSYILHILRLCPIPQLDELEVDYHQDGEEYSLLRYITAAFPALTSLKVRRYCASDATDVDVVG